jgi:4,5-dihydroxyphthalate decarboxylase
MSDIKLDIGFHDYEHVRALIDGTVKIDGVEPTFHTARIVSDIFERMVAHHEFGVSELGWTFYLRTLDLEDPPFIAIPVFLARQFRHSAIFVNSSKGIESPRDLAGKTVGEFATYGHDAGVAATTTTSRSPARTGGRTASAPTASPSTHSCVGTTSRDCRGVA